MNIQRGLVGTAMAGIVASIVAAIFYLYNGKGEPMEILVRFVLAGIVAFGIYILITYLPRAKQNK